MATRKSDLPFLRMRLEGSSYRTLETQDDVLSGLLVGSLTSWAGMSSGQLTAVTEKKI